MNLCDYGLGSCFVSSLDTMAIDSPQELREGTTAQGLNAANVPLRAGRPTREELLVYYPAKFTWAQLKTFVNSGYVRPPLG